MYLNVNKFKKYKYCIIFICFIFLFVYFSKKIHVDINESFLNQRSCPACYGLDLCAKILHNHSKTNIETKWNAFSTFNIKNVFYGTLKNKKYVFKKLAHDNELSNFDKVLCETHNKLKNGSTSKDCNSSDIMREIVTNEKDVNKIIRKYSKLFEKSYIAECHDESVIHYLWSKFDERYSSVEHFITLLAINPEPLIHLAFKETGVFPHIIGACGRVMVEDYVGPTLAELVNEPWITRVRYARQLLYIAKTFSNSKYRLYLTDVTADNFAVDKNGIVKIVDSEDIIIVDSEKNGLKLKEHHNDGFGCQSCLSYSIEDLCYHKSADHNYYAICKGLLSKKPYTPFLPQGLLHSPPKEYETKFPNLFPLIEDCGYVTNQSSDNVSRKYAADKLYLLMTKILTS